MLPVARACPAYCLRVSDKFSVNSYFVFAASKGIADVQHNCNDITHEPYGLAPEEFATINLPEIVLFCAL